MVKTHEKYMHRCIQLAKNGLGTTYPNPLVGSVVVYQDRIIGEGWHLKSGAPHAEVNAINSVKDKATLKEATIYVNLEPCSYTGKTPPCSDLIISSEIKNVVVGSLDPNPQVAGRGIKKLIEAGCEVTTGVLENKCAELNKRFLSFHQKKRPYIILKWAQTRDGFIAPPLESRKEINPVWITNEYSRQLTHKMRGQEMAILVGTNTAQQDNPSLTTRNWSGNNPVRIVIDRRLRLDKKLSVFNEKAKTIVITDKENPSPEKDIHYEKINFSEAISSQICDVLYKNKIQSVIIEGGTKTLQTFIDENFWDEAFVFTGSTSFKNGITAPVINGKFILEEPIRNDSLQLYKNR